MPNESVTYKCPSCSGELTFDIVSQKFCCQYCGTSAAADELKAMSQSGEVPVIKSRDTDRNGEAVDDIPDEFRTRTRLYTCPSCGSSIMTDSKHSATAVCPYCNSQIIIGSRVSDDCKPDYVIPFRITKEQAMEKISEYMTGKFFLPKLLEGARFEPEIHGLYLPIWLADCTVTAELDMVGVANPVPDHKHKMVNVYPGSEIAHFIQKGIFDFKNIPADAAKSFRDDLFEGIEPYDYSEMTEFDMMYLSGYSAEKFSVTQEEVTNYISMRARRHARGRMGDSKIWLVQKLNKDTAEVDDINVKYAMLPVWVCNFVYHGETYSIAINGQTGKLCGSLPMRKKLLLGMQFLIGGLLMIPTILLLVYFMSLYQGENALKFDYESVTTILYLIALGLSVSLCSASFFKRKVKKTYDMPKLRRTAAAYTNKASANFVRNEKIYYGKYDGPLRIPESQAKFR